MTAINLRETIGADFGTDDGSGRLGVKRIEDDALSGGVRIDWPLDGDAIFPAEAAAEHAVGIRHVQPVARHGVKVMGSSAGGVSFESILGMTFPDLADLWEEAQYW